MDNAVTLTIGAIEIAVQLFRVSAERDPLAPTIARQTEPLAPADWPVAPAAIEAAVAAELRAFDCPADRANVAWALGRLNSLPLMMDPDCHVHPAQSQTQRDRKHRHYRRLAGEGAL